MYVKSYKYKQYHIAYLKQGSGSPMLFLHNGGCDHHIWNHQISYFSQRFTVYAIDWLGFGQSDRPLIDYTLPLFVDMLESFIDGLRLDKVVLVTNCIGSAAAIQYARQKHSKVRAMILMNVLSERTFMFGQYGLQYRLYKKFPKVSQRVAALFNKLRLPHFGRVRALDALYGKHNEPDDSFTEHFHQLYSHPAQVRMVNNLLFNASSFNVLDTIESLENRVPTLLMWGKDNKILPMQYGKPLCEKLKGDKTVYLDDCGHLAMRERPLYVNQLIDSFISV